jgi:mRNA interferase RelE/StbE
VAYRLELSTRALRDLKKLPEQVRQRLQPHIDSLATDPRPPGVVKLEGDENAYRIRVGDYRVLYEIHDAVLRVAVVKVGHRRDIHR